MKGGPKRSGVIVNLTGIGCDLLDPSYIAGGVGNAAMAAFTKSLGSNSHKVGVRVVGVNPGACATERYERLARAKAQERYGNPDRWQEALGTLPFGRYTTGAILTIDGGVTGGREIPRYSFVFEHDHLRKTGVHFSGSCSKLICALCMPALFACD